MLNPMRCSYWTHPRNHGLVGYKNTYLGPWNGDVSYQGGGIPYSYTRIRGVKVMETEWKTDGNWMPTFFKDYMTCKVAGMQLSF